VVFQRNLAEKIGHVVINLNNFEGSVPAHKLETMTLPENVSLTVDVDLVNLM